MHMRIIHERKGSSGTAWMSKETPEITYGFMVFATEHQAERTVVEMRNRMGGGEGSSLN